MEGKIEGDLSPSLIISSFTYWTYKATFSSLSTIISKASCLKLLYKSSLKLVYKSSLKLVTIISCSNITSCLKLVSENSL